MIFQECEYQDTFKLQRCEFAFNIYEVIALLGNDTIKDFISN